MTQCLPVAGKRFRCFLIFSVCFWFLKKSEGRWYYQKVFFEQIVNDTVKICKDIAGCDTTHDEFVYLSEELWIIEDKYYFYVGWSEKDG